MKIDCNPDILCWNYNLQQRMVTSLVKLFDAYSTILLHAFIASKTQLCAASFNRIIERKRGCNRRRYVLFLPGIKKLNRPIPIEFYKYHTKASNCVFGLPLQLDGEGRGDVLPNLHPQTIRPIHWRTRLNIKCCIKIIYIGKRPIHSIFCRRVNIS